MIKERIYRWLLVSMIFIIIVIKIFSLNAFHTERFYYTGFYIFFSKIMRFLFGWIHFSVGDILYLIAGCWLFWKIIKNVILVFQRKLSIHLAKQKGKKILLIICIIYIVFNIFWGLNYNRKGIAWQLHISATNYDENDLDTIQQLLIKRINYTKQIMINEHIAIPPNRELFTRAKNCYDTARKTYPFIAYHILSVKPSLYGLAGDYLGFTGYYNPFTGEAQVNTTVPRFLLPNIALHEMGHQLGYAKEDEANFSAYIAASNSHDTLFQYSVYLDLFVYANREIFFYDSAAAKKAIMQLAPAVRADLVEWKKFSEKYTSFIEPAISWLYGRYLQINQQPKGLKSYSEVIATLIAYYKKYGKV